MDTHTTWAMKLLRDICKNVQYGYTASAMEKSIGPKFLRITDIVSEAIDWETVPHCEIDSNKKDKYLLIQGDIVIARTGATAGYAKYIKANPESVFASYLVRLQLIESVNSRYVGYIIESEMYKDFIKGNWGGSAQPNANAQILTSFHMPIPPLLTQHKIATVLSTYDDLIENNLRRIKILEEMAQNFYREWFVKFRFPGHQNTRFVDSPLGKIPAGWEVTNLGESCYLIMGQSPKSEFYNNDGIGLPFHQGVTNFGDRFPSDRLYCTIEGRIAEAGDILFSVRAPVGRMNIADKKIVIGRGISAIRHKEGYQFLLWEQLRNRFTEVDTMGNGSIFASVTKSDMQGIELIFPPTSAMSDATFHLGPIHNEIDALTKKNTTLRQTRDLLLPKLISGEIDVSALDIAIPEEAVA